MKRYTVPPPKENDVRKSIATYVKLQYPRVIFRIDFAAGINLGTLAGIHSGLQSGSGYPDMFVAEARHGHHGLFLEIKRDRDSVYRKDGSLRENKHVAEQAAILKRLSDLGYKALFVCGFDDARKELDKYLL